MEKTNDEKEIISYLLGDLEEDEQRRVEEQLLINDEYFDLLLVAEDDLIDDYARSALSDQARASFEAHFLSTPERRDKLRFALALRNYVTTEPAPVEANPAEAKPVEAKAASRPAWWKPLFSTPALRLAAAAIIVMALGLGIWRVAFYESELTKGLSALNKAYSAERPVEARISKLDYAPFPVTRSADARPVDKLSLNRSERILFDEAEAHPGAESFHALGKLYLTEKKFDEAIEQFEKALKLDDKNAQLHSDLGAALLEKGKVDLAKEDPGISLGEFARSLEHLNKALELNGSLLEALFNRALCHQYMSLLNQAEEDWRKYVEKDSTSRWAEEARERLRQIEEQKQRISQDEEQLFQDFLAARQAKDDDSAWEIISRNRDINGSLIENRLLDEYLDLAIKGKDSEAGERLRALAYAGELEITKARDHYISNLASFYGLTSQADKQALAQARHLTKLGHENLNKFNSEEALSLYNRAGEIFVRAGDVCEAAYIKYPQGHSYLLQHKPESGLAIFQQLADDCETRQYRWLLAQTLNAIGNANTALRDFSKAINYSKRSLELSEEIGDVRGVMKTLNQLAGEYFSLNNYDKSLGLYARSLALIDVSRPGLLQLWRNYFSIAQALDQMGLYAAAIDYQKEALQTAIQARMPQLICRSYTYLGLHYGNRQEYEEATKNIQLSFDVSKTFSDKVARVETTAYSFLQLGYVYKQAGDFIKALANYDEAIQLYGELESKYFDYVARKGKLLCCMAQGGCPSIEQELAATLDLFDKNRAMIQEESNRNTYFDGEQNIYDLAIDFEFSTKGNSRKAFEYSEACRARSLCDMAGADIKLIDDRNNPDILFDRASQPKSMEEIQERMPDQTQILQYAALKDKLLIWVVSKGKEHVSAATSISLEKLKERIDSYRLLISRPPEGNNEEAEREAKYLYDALITPVEFAFDAGKQLCIVPDKVLNYLPFDALISPTSGKYFIEEHDFVESPSSRMFIICSDAAREKNDGRSEDLLSVGNPLFDAKAYPFLSDLPSAAKEAEAIAGYYKSPHRFITGRAATKERVETEMEKSDVIHLALHSVVNELSPHRSKLVLAEDRTGGNNAGKPDGAIQAYEIYKLDLSRARLVVLSACQTGIERYYGGEGMIGISRPFIAKRVPLVVASLWPVNSDSTTELMISFHKHRKSEKGISTTEALRRAQRDMIESPEPSHRSPYHWASFVAIGGYAEF
jgi:CHAT domain-containing protein